MFIYQVYFVIQVLVVVHAAKISMAEVFYIEFLYLEDECHNMKTKIIFKKCNSNFSQQWL
jgi:hypothetical protein